MYVLAATAATAATDNGPTWAQLFGAVGVGTVLASVITGVFLMVQTSMTNRRESDRLAVEAEQRKADRDHDGAARAQARKDALDDQWRTERQEAHTEVFSPGWSL